MSELIIIIFALIVSVALCALAFQWGYWSEKGRKNAQEGG